MKKIILSAILFFISFPIFSQWTQTNGIKGTDQVNCIIRSSHSMFAGTARGLFKSTDEGLSWKISCGGLKYYQVSSLASKGDTLFAGTSNGLFISYDDGNNWIEGGYQENYVYYLFMHNNRLFLWTFDQMYYSDDLGQTFNYSCAYDNIQHMFAFNNYLFISLFGTGVYRSSDNGMTWSSANNGLITLNAYGFTSSGSILFLSTRNNPDGRVYTSTNNGNNWIPCSYSFPINNLGVLSTEGNYVYANAGAEMYISTDLGSSWINRTGELPYNWSTSILSYNGKTFTSPVFSGIYRTTNQGVNWFISDSGFYNAATMSFASGGGFLFAAAGTSGIWRTSDNGTLWVKTGQMGSGNTSVNAVAFTNGKLYAGRTGSSDNLFASTNMGTNWTVINGFYGTYVNDIAVKDSVMLVATNMGVKKSTNGGLNWTQTPLSTSLTVTRLFIKDIYLYAASYNGIYYSTNLGNTWLTTSGISATVTDIAANGNDLYSSTYSKVFKSTNNGSTWATTNMSATNCYKLLSVNNAVLVAANKGIFITTNGGLNWNSVSEGLSLLDSRSLYSMNGYVFLGTYGAGVYKRPVSQIIGIRNISSGIPDNFSLYQNYPNPFNPVTKIKFDVAANNRGAENLVTLKVYDILGKEIMTLVNEQLKPGTYEVTFDGNGIPSGIYFYRLLAGGEYKKILKMVLMK